MEKSSFSSVLWYFLSTALLRKVAALVSKAVLLFEALRLTVLGILNILNQVFNAFHNIENWSFLAALENARIDS